MESKEWLIAPRAGAQQDGWMRFQKWNFHHQTKLNFQVRNDMFLEKLLYNQLRTLCIAFHSVCTSVTIHLFGLNCTKMNFGIRAEYKLIKRENQLFWFQNQTWVTFGSLMCKTWQQEKKKPSWIHSNSRYTRWHEPLILFLIFFFFVPHLNFIAFRNLTWTAHSWRVSYLTLLLWDNFRNWVQGVITRICPAGGPYSVQRWQHASIKANKSIIHHSNCKHTHTRTHTRACTHARTALTAHLHNSTRSMFDLAGWKVSRK